MTQSLSAEHLWRMHTVLGGYIDRGEMRPCMSMHWVRFPSAAHR